jgi:STAM-binding protein
VKYWLKVGENHRRAGKRYVEANDLENAFVEYGKAATIVLEKLPVHREYYTTLNADQRHNLGLVSSLFAPDRCISLVCRNALRLF